MECVVAGDYKKDYFNITINKLIKLYFWPGIYGLKSDGAVFTFERIPIHTMRAQRAIRFHKYNTKKLFMVPETSIPQDIYFGLIETESIVKIVQK